MAFGFDSTVPNAEENIFDSSPVASYDARHNLNVKYPEKSEKSKHLN